MGTDDSDDSVDWLDDDEMAAWLALVSLFVRLPAALDAQLRHDAGISHFDYQVLAVLSTTPGRTRQMSDLADLVDGSLSRLSHTARRLEDRGWLTRAPDPADARCTVATLTDEGMAKVVATAPGHVAAVRRHVFDPLDGRQVDHLRAIATRIVATIDPGAGG